MFLDTSRKGPAGLVPPGGHMSINSLGLLQFCVRIQGGKAYGQSASQRLRFYN